MPVAEIESRRSSPRGPDEVPMTLVDFYLHEQQSLTAVDRFTRFHEATATPLQERYYSALMPAAPPAAGEQYAFDVDLDACSGCKSCVTACHTLNGLDDDETWRDVGLLHGGNASQPFLQHVTAACHHCLDPACLNVCPVRAYEKDPGTGIVRHLDDQCIGCQYCILACPYDVPKYSRARGIVRKCDLCSDRLAVGEAPACVQACPNSAIRIAVVSRREAAENCETGLFLPGAPDPHLTQPTTSYRSRRVIPRNALPADYYSVQREHAHWPLIIMLVLTQLSVGAFLVNLLQSRLAPREVMATVRGTHAAFALGFGLLALAASTLHLGRPLYAFRAVVGLRTSWLSREIVTFGLFAAFASLYAGVVWWRGGVEAAGPDAALEVIVVLTGLAGVFCSIMIYARTRRAFWAGTPTTLRFLLSTLLLGSVASLCAAGASAAATKTAPGVAPIKADIAILALTLMIVTTLKLVFEATVFLHLRDRQHTQLKRSALLMKGDLVRPVIWRFVLGIAGGGIAPALLLARDFDGGFVATLLLGGMFTASLAGEFLERYLFFSAVAAPRMPGGLTT
jgi:formate dehydrogenase iron-sulfur subunit